MKRLEPALEERLLQGIDDAKEIKNLRYEINARYARVNYTDQQILNAKDSHILDDPFIIQYLDDLLRNIRLNVIIAKVKPYKTVSIEYLAKQLSLPKEDICALLSELILEEKIKGQID